MTSEDLIKFNIKQQWKKARIQFYKEQLETINKLSSVISDMPKAYSQVYDKEAEKLSKLMDQINNIIDDINNSTVDIENKIKEQLDKLEDKYGLLLYHHYILGDSIKYIAKEIIHNEVKYTYKLREKALEEFDKLN